MVKTKHSILTSYQNKVNEQQALIDNLEKKLNRISFSRLGLFISDIAFVALIISSGFSWPLGVLLAVPVILFLYQVKRQTTVQNELSYAQQLLWVYQNEVDQLSLSKNGYDDGRAYADEAHPYTSDLDIVGAGSLYGQLNRCKTEDGQDLLAGSLSKPFDEMEIISRQDAIRELEGHIGQTFHFRAELQGHESGKLRMIKAKLNQLPLQLVFTKSKFLNIYVKLSPFLMFGLLTLAAIYGGYLWKVFGLMALINAALTFFYMGKINKVYYGFTGSSNLLNSFSGAIKWTEEVMWKSHYIRSLFVAGPGAGGLQISRQVKQLASIIQAFDARLNFLLAAFLNVFLLWDLKYSIRLGKWHEQSSEGLMGGLYRISQFEELISFATMKHNQPDWNFPKISNDFRCRVKQMGHPLIPEPVRIPNDFELSGTPTVDIVTGSNMAGKSTFLRTLGINMVLAYAGGPVCAAEMELSVFKIYSYMRIKDSLNDQTSTFKAELNRLKMILDAIAKIPNALVLIDEMLRGTNSRDKYLGSKVFIEKLIEQRTNALFATHDLQLSEMEADHAKTVRNYHFDIQLIDGEMTFDYKLKNGPCKTFNAALLLKEIGLTLT